MYGNLMKYKDVLKPLFPWAVRKRIKERMFYNWLSSFDKNDKNRFLSMDMPWGVNVYGLINDCCGIAQASRGNIQGFAAAGIPVNIIDSQTATEADKADYAVNYFHLNPDLLQNLAFRLSEDTWQNHYNVAYWVWEQEKLPPEWIKCAKLFDEIWTASEFSAEAIRRSVDLPVYVVPHIVAPQYDRSWDKKRWGLPEDVFLVLVAFDCNSGPERKNPLGAVRAFCRAFRPDERVGLVIKARNLTPKVKDMLLAALAGRDRVFFLTDDYPKNAVNDLIKECDVYISLHRGEGFGLIMAEAMYLGTPVVATNWSGNTDFMDDTTACLVDSTFISLEKDRPPFKKGSRWVQPDEEQAAGYLRKLYDDPAFYKRIADNAAARIEKQLSVETIAALIRGRMENIQKEIASWQTTSR